MHGPINLEYICCCSYASNDLTPFCVTIQVSLDSLQQYTHLNTTVTTVYISQHYRYNSTHVLTVQAHIPQYYSYNNGHISTIQLQLRHDLLFPFQHGVYDAARLVHRLVNLLIFPLDDVVRELRQIEGEIVFVGHRHVDTVDLHTYR